MTSRPLAGQPAPSAAQAPATLRFDLVELETFLVVVELGSFSLAAKRLHISQPSVTSRVQRLESLLKTKLLIRTTRRVEPTPAGMRLRERAEAALRDLRALMLELQAQAEVERLRVRVASTPMIAAVMLPPLIRAFGQRYPDVSIQLRDLQYEEVVEKIEAGEADVAVVAFDNDSSKLDFEPLSEEDLLLMVPAAHPLAGAGSVTLLQLADVPLMMLERYSMLRDRLAEAFAQRGMALRPAQEVVNLNTLLGLVDAGLGATVLPQSMAQRYAKDTRATLRIVDVPLRRRFGILRARNAMLTPAAASFVRFLRENFAAAAEAP